jgi:hypothetical protein
MTHSESVAAIGAALAKAQGAIEGASKDSKNPHFNSKYADLASVLGACREALSLNGIGVLQSPANDANLVRMRTLLVHSSGEWIESDDLVVQARDAGPQAIGSCLTYLRRYQLAAMVGVAPEDDDAEAGEGRTGSRVTPISIPQKQATAKPPAYISDALAAALWKEAAEIGWKEFELKDWLLKNVGCDSLRHIPAGRYEDVKKQILSAIV